MSSDFNPEPAWAYYGDDTVKKRVVRIFDHYDVEWWHTGPAIRFVTNRDDVVKNVEKALRGCKETLDHVGTDAGSERYRISPK